MTSNVFQQALTAIRARERATTLNKPTAHDAAMANAFPLGAGYGRLGGAKRVERSIDRAMVAVAAVREASRLEALAVAFDAGHVNAQGRNIDAGTRQRSAARAQSQAKRDERRRVAREEIERVGRCNVTGEVWADAHGYFGGSARRFVISEHAEFVGGQSDG